MNSIYALLDENDTRFYIGKSKNPERRRKRHLYDAMVRGLKHPVQNKIRKLMKIEGYVLQLSILESKIPDEVIDEKEKSWIQKIKESGVKLYNATEGGDGGRLSPESLEKIRQKNIGRKRSIETKKRISEAKKGIPFTIEHKWNLSVARKKRKVSEETKQKMSASSLGKINTKQFILYDPEGNPHLTTNGLTDFCRNNDLSPPNLMKVLNGHRPNHKGWTIQRCNL